jgi:hypothetical protein
VGAEAEAEAEAEAAADRRTEMRCGGRRRRPAPEMGSWFEMGSGGEETFANFEFGVASSVHPTLYTAARRPRAAGGSLPLSRLQIGRL